MNKREVGSSYEGLAADFLKKQGLRILEMNYRIRSGEIDIIAEDNKFLVFVEVKYRKNSSAGHPEEAVNMNKIRQICKVSDHYRLYKKISPSRACRYDVVAIEGEDIRWYKNAFSYVR